MVVKNPQMEVSEVMWVPRSHPSHLDLVLKPMVTWMPHFQNPPHNKGFRIVFAFFFGSGFGFFVLAFFPGTICLVFATVWN